MAGMLPSQSPPSPHEAWKTVLVTGVTQCATAIQLVSFLISETAQGREAKRPNITNGQMADFSASELWSREPESHLGSQRYPPPLAESPWLTPVCLCPETATQTFLPAIKPLALSNALKQKLSWKNTSIDRAPSSSPRASRPLS